MTDILAKIIEGKRDEVATLKRDSSMADIDAAARAASPVRGFADALHAASQTGYGLIAELKKASPSKGLIREDFTPETLATAYEQGAVIEVPIAHHEGNYQADAETLARLNGEGRVAFRYVENPNGAVEDIAGILSENRRVLGMMPHPERACEPLHGGTDGAGVFAGLAQALVAA